MWHLNYISKAKEAEYVQQLLPKMQERHNKITGFPAITAYLDDSKLKWLLTAHPDELHQEYISLLARRHSIIKGFILYNKIPKKAEQRTPKQKQFFRKFGPIAKIFDYYTLISQNQDLSYQLAEWIGVNTCVYCNRQYTLTVRGRNTKIVRPEFDHFLPKSTYPFFALSLYNLIPSCHICNSNCKGKKEPPMAMNPYLTKPGFDYFKFGYLLKDYDRPDVIVKDLYDDGDQGSKVQEMLDIFKIKEIYDGHTGLELHDLYTFAQKYSSTYLTDVLSKTVFTLRIPPEEAYRILFGTESDPLRYNHRPFSKFKKDILQAMDIFIHH